MVPCTRCQASVACDKAAVLPEAKPRKHGKKTIPINDALAPSNDAPPTIDAPALNGGIPTPAPPVNHAPASSNHAPLANDTPTRHTDNEIALANVPTLTQDEQGAAEVEAKKATAKEEAKEAMAKEAESPPHQVPKTVPDVVLPAWEAYTASQGGDASYASPTSTHMEANAVSGEEVDELEEEGGMAIPGAVWPAAGGDGDDDDEYLFISKASITDQGFGALAFYPYEQFQLRDLGIEVHKRVEKVDDIWVKHAGKIYDLSPFWTGTLQKAHSWLAAFSAKVSRSISGRSHISS